MKLDVVPWWFFASGLELFGLSVGENASGLVIFTEEACIFRRSSVCADLWSHRRWLWETCYLIESKWVGDCKEAVLLEDLVMKKKLVGGSAEEYGVHGY